MFKSILATAAAALVAITFSASSHAGGYSGSMGSNGPSLNGMSINGMSINGMSINGMSINGKGRGLNGVSANGTNEQAAAAPSFAIDGIELPAQAR